MDKTRDPSIYKRSDKTCSCEWHEYFPTAWKIKEIDPDCEVHGEYARDPAPTEEES